MQPSQAQSSISRIVRTASRRRTRGETSDPSRMQAPNVAVSAPIWPPDSPSRSASTTMVSSRPGSAKLPRPQSSAQVRRNGWLQRKRTPSATPRAQAGRIDGACVLERRPHADERADREEVRRGVDEERHRAADAEERAADGRSEQHDGRRSCLLHARGGRQLLRRDDRAQRPRSGRCEDRRARALHECDDRDLPEGEPVGHDRGTEACDGQATDDVGPDHQPLPVEAVGRDARGQGEDRRRQEPGEHHDARLRRRAGRREDQQRVRDGRRLGARAGQQPARLQESEVPVARERDDAHDSEHPRRASRPGPG